MVQFVKRVDIRFMFVIAAITAIVTGLVVIAANPIAVPLFGMAGVIILVFLAVDLVKHMSKSSEHYGAREYFHMVFVGASLGLATALFVTLILPREFGNSLVGGLGTLIMTLIALGLVLNAMGNMNKHLRQLSTPIRPSIVPGIPDRYRDKTSSRRG